MGSSVLYFYVVHFYFVLILTVFLDNTNAEHNPENNFTQIEMEETTDINKIQVDLVKCFQNQELQVIKEGSNRYIVISEDGTGLKQEEIVTKQNKDGTVSFTSIRGTINSVLISVHEGIKN